MFKNKKCLEKWLRFSRCGEQIEDTPFVPFKVPIHTAIERLPINERFTFEDVFRKHPNIGLVIDLTNTTKYYNPSVISRFGAIYCKIGMQGHGNLPDNQQILEFNRIVSNFMRTNRNQLIGVHCTHGVNRTGYMICQYMISKLRFPANLAVHSFQEARGHEIERKSYVDALYRMDVNSYRNNYNARYARNNTLNSLVQPRTPTRTVSARTRPSRWSS